MPNLAPADVLREMGGDHPPRCCYCCGEDGAAVLQLEKRILKKLTDDDPLATTTLDGLALDWNRLEEACMFSPMFQPYNVILLRDLDVEALPPATIDNLLTLLAQLPPRVVVLVVITTLSVYTVKRGEPVFAAKTKKVTTFFEKNGILCVCEKKNAVTMGKQIQERAKRHGSDISRTDAEQLANRCLCDSMLVRMELDKLLAFADGQTITAEMLDQLTPTQPDADAYRLARAVTSGDGATAFHLLAALTAKNDDAKTILSLLGVLSGTFIDWYRAKLGQGAAQQVQDVAKAFDYPKNREFAVRNAMRDCHAMSLPQLRTCVKILRETDRACKSSRTAPRLLLEQAIVRMLCTRREGQEVQTGRSIWE